MTLGARVPGVTAVGMTHLGCPTINIVGGLHVVVGVPKIVQSGLWRGRSSERLINTERRREVPAIEHESTREREKERGTLTEQQERHQHVMGMVLSTLCGVC